MTKISNSSSLTLPQDSACEDEELAEVKPVGKEWLS